MLTITFLGVGGAFAKRNHQSNALIEIWNEGPDRQQAPDDNLLIDFGATGPLALHELKDEDGFAYLNDKGRIHFPSIKRVFISHLHADHIGGLEEMAFANRFLYAGFKPQLISSDKILNNLWEQSLRGGLGVLKDKCASLSDYFESHAIAMTDTNRSGLTIRDKYRFTIFPTDHLSIREKYDWPSLGLFIDEAGSGDGAFFSGDTRYDFEAYGSMLSRSKIVFHDVQLFDQPDPVHALLSELKTMPEAIRRKTWLYHFDDTWDDPEFDHIKELFAGFVLPKKRYVIFN